MFTGIVEELGTVAVLEQEGGRARIGIRCRQVSAGARVGDSIAVNGCCLTVTELDDGFTADLMGETLTRTALGSLTVGSAVNLERPMAADARFGGHLVQGHVDGVGEVLAVEPEDGSTRMVVRFPAALGRYVVEKGSIAVDGASLTVIAVDDTSFAVGLVPHTLTATVLGQRRPGDPVNLEVDIVAKYVERLLAAAADPVAGPAGAAGRGGPQ